jgi:hypothetical protein
MNQRWLMGAAALAVTIFQIDGAFAQRGGGRAGGGFHGTALGAQRGVIAPSIGGSALGAPRALGAPSGVIAPSIGGSAAFHRAVVAAGQRGLATQYGPGGASWSGWGWRGRWGWPGAADFGVGAAGYYSDSIDDPCLFRTHYGWINTC